MRPALRPSAVPVGEPLAWVVRADLVESVHSGHLLVTDAAGNVVLQRGQDITLYPRSCLKPFQAIAMLEAGAPLQGEALALTSASHSGTPQHVRGVRSMLTAVGLSEADLRNTPDLPLDAAARADWIRGGGEPAAITQNCSGKHAGMLTTCVTLGWDTQTYLRPTHPLQRAIAETLAQVTGQAAAHTAVDGCGAPAYSTTLSGLARGMRTLVTGGPSAQRVAEAMRAHPDLISGPGQLDTEAMRSVPGLIVKGGADGVLVAALPDGATVVLKVGDGSARPRPMLLGLALRALGLQGPWDWERVPVLGHGRPAGSVLPAFGPEAPELG